MKYTYLFLLSYCLLQCKPSDKQLPYYDSPDFTPKWTISKEKTFHRIRAFSLIDQDHQLFSEKQMDAKICIVDFFFTSCPGICPRMTNSMAQIQNAFKKDEDILLLSHSVTPEKDSASVLKRYAQEKNIDTKNWKLLTGSKKEIYDLGRRYYFVEEDQGIEKNDEVFLHTENFILVDKQRYIRGIYNGLDPNSIADAIRDIKLLKEE